MGAHSVRPSPKGNFPEGKICFLRFAKVASRSGTQRPYLTEGLARASTDRAESVAARNGTPEKKFYEARSGFVQIYFWACVATEGERNDKPGGNRSEATFRGVAGCPRSGGNGKVGGLWAGPGYRGPALQ